MPVGVLEIVQAVFTVSKAIYDQAKLAKANQAQCLTLAKRVQVIESSLQGLTALQRGKLFRQPLEELQGCLEEILQWIESCGNEGRIRQFLKARVHQGKFPAFSEQLQRLIQQLELGLGAQALINHEQDVEDQKADQAYLRSHLAAIEAGQAEELKALQHLDAKQVSHQMILTQQMAAYHREVMAALGLLQPLSPGRVPASDAKAVEAKRLLPEHLEIAYCDLRFDFSRVLRQGVLGEVYVGEWQSQPVMIKQLSGILTPAEQKYFAREVRILSRLQNAQVVQFYGACLEEGHACLVMEPLPHTLPTYRAAQALSPQQYKRLVLDLLRGLHYLHVKGVLHQDLRSETVLVSEEGRAKLSEFGLAQSQSKSLATLYETPQVLPICAPEVLQRHPKYSTASDVFSVGTVLWELFTGRVAYAGYGEGLREAILSGHRESVAGIPDFYAKIIEACWDPIPAKRPLLPTLIDKLLAYQPPLPLLVPIPTPTPSPSPAALPELSAEVSQAEVLRQQGLGAEKKGNYVEAQRLYREALAKGSVGALTSLGMLLWKGQGCPKDAKAAYQHFQQAADKGHPRGVYNLGYLLETGDEGLPQDLQRAVATYHCLVEASTTPENLRGEALARIEKIRSRHGVVFIPPVASGQAPLRSEPPAGSPSDLKRR